MREVDAGDRAAVLGGQVTGRSAEAATHVENVLARARCDTTCELDGGLAAADVELVHRFVRELLSGSTQFGQLQRGLPKRSPTMLSKRLAELQKAGLAVRRRTSGHDGHECRLTAAGRELSP